MAETEFALAEAPLDGWNLIEANAGTGKTYSIAGLYLRLLLERELEPEQILVVTFTRVATGELKTRLLERLRSAAAGLRDGAPNDALEQRIASRLTDRAAALDRLQRAIRAFDLAQVYTLHGFCQQLLNEFSFAVGFDPDRELIEDESTIIEPLVRRQWRRVSRDFSPEFAAYVAARHQLDPVTMSNTIRRLLDKPYALLEGPAPVPLARLEADFRAARGALSELWQRRTAAARELLSSHRGLNRRSYRAHQMEAQWRALAAVLADPWRNGKLGPIAGRLGQAALDKGTKRGFDPPVDSLFAGIDAYLAALDALCAGYQAVARGLPLAVYRGVGTALDAWKREQSVLTYRDLIMNLHEALQGPSGATIRNAVGPRYSAALLDEFQDTDPIQFAIVRALFGDPAATVFLVGDPKQSLYGFRGADVFAYLAARAAARRRYRLTRDWRAAPRLLAAINRLFTARDRPFALAPIEFAPSAAAERPPPRLQIDGRDAIPLQAWELAAGRAKPVLRSDSANAVAAEVERLLDPASAARLYPADEPMRPLRASDIAVLVHRHDQAAEVAAALNRIGIACVQPGVDSVFDSEEAAELERILHGVLFSELPGRLAGALSTRLVGQDAEQVAALGRDDAHFELWFERFQNYRVTWEEQGITALITTLVSDFSVAARWLPRVDGHRRLTNLYHLIELMERHAHDRIVTPGEQLEWLHLKRQSREFAGEDALLRLESDADLVSILTIHKSKGLQFPVVLCPYLWDGSPPQDQPDWIEYHRQHDSELTIDFGSSDFGHAVGRHRDEQLAETLRLAYVAMTRAEIRCCFVWGVAAGTGSSALAYLLAADGESRQEIEVAYSATSAHAGRLEESSRRLRQLGVSVGPPPRRSVGSRPARSAALFGRYRTAVREIRPRWSVYSYSSLAGGGWEEAWDYDAEAGQLDLAPAPGTGIHQLPPGARTGLMVHEIFEELDDFSAPATELVARTGVKLEKFGFSAELSRPLGCQLHRCLHTPLLSAEQNLELARIAPGDAIRELEFHFRLRDASLRALWRRIRGTGAPPDTRAINGFVRGFIDLIFRFNKKFYIVDYKTNYLGKDIEAYDSEGLRGAIRRHAYDLQYHLYTVAAHRYLTRRLPGYRYPSDFGGVFYLFIRGMEPERGPRRGVFYDLPAARTVAELDALLGAASGSRAGD